MVVQKHSVRGWYNNDDTGYWNYYSLALHLFLFHLVVLTVATRLNDESKGPQADLCAPGLVSLPILQRVVA